MIIDTKDIEITLCKSDQIKHLGAHVGVQIKHFETNITVHSTNHKTQYMNKLAALDKLNEGLARGDVSRWSK
jgi:protein subunit release factor A